MKKKTAALLLILLHVSIHSFANYITCLDKEQATKTLALLSGQKEIFYSQTAVGIEDYIKIEIDTSYIIENNECQEIFLHGLKINGQDQGKVFSKSIDLAYTWFNDNGIGRNLAHHLEIPLEYASFSPFYWKNLKPVKKDAPRSAQKKITTIQEELNTYSARASHLEIIDDEGNKILADSVKYEFSATQSSLIIHQYYSKNKEKRYIIQLDQCFSLDLKTYNNEKFLYVHGANYKQFYENGQLKTSRAFLRLKVDLCPQANQEIIENIEELIQLSENYYF